MNLRFSLHTFNIVKNWKRVRKKRERKRRRLINNDACRLLYSTRVVICVTQAEVFCWWGKEILKWDRFKQVASGSSLRLLACTAESYWILLSQETILLCQLLNENIFYEQQIKWFHWKSMPLFERKTEKNMHVQYCARVNCLSLEFHISCMRQV